MGFFNQSMWKKETTKKRRRSKYGFWNCGPDDSWQICATESPERVQDAIIGREVKKKRNWPYLISDFITFPPVQERGGNGQVFHMVKQVQFDVHPSPTLAAHQNLILTGDKVQALSHTPGRLWINAVGQPHSDYNMVENGKAGVRCWLGLITAVGSR